MQSIAISSIIDILKANSSRWVCSPIIPDDILELLYDERLFKLLVPLSFQGHACTLLEATRIYEQLAAADGSIGWLVQIGAGGAFFVPSFTPEIAEYIYDDKRSVIAGSGYPTGTAKRVNGGYRCTGHWKYASGAQYATFFTANVIIDDSQQVRAFAFHRDQVSLHCDWHAMGMRATSSWSFSVKDVFVPDEFSFVVGEKLWDPGLDIYNVPFLSFAIASIGSVIVGTVRCFYELALQMVNPSRKEQIELIYLRVSEYRNHFWGLIHELESFSHAMKEPVLIDQLNDQLRQCLLNLRDCLYEGYSIVGMQAADEHTPLNRAYRDCIVAFLHELVRPSVR